MYCRASRVRLRASFVWEWITTQCGNEFLLFMGCVYYTYEVTSGKCVSCDRFVHFVFSLLDYIDTIYLKCIYHSIFCSNPCVQSVSSFRAIVHSQAVPVMLLGHSTSSLTAQSQGKKGLKISKIYTIRHHLARHHYCVVDTVLPLLSSA